MFSSLCHHLFFTLCEYPKLITRLSSQTFPSPRTRSGSAAVSRYFNTLRLRLFKPRHPLDRTDPLPPTTVSNIVPTLESQTKAALIRLMQGALGMSGAICACVAVTCLVDPAGTFYLFFVLPVQASHGLLGLVLFDVMGLLRGWQ